VATESHRVSWDLGQTRPCHTADFRARAPFRLVGLL